METEQTPKGEVKEEVKEEISQPVPAASKEEKATSAKDDQWKREMQSRVDKAEHASKVANEQLQKLQQQEEQRRLETRKKEIEALEGEPEEQAKLRRKHELEDTLIKLEEANKKNQGAVERKYDQALELATKYNLGLSEARDLMKAETPREMELLAQLKVKDLETAEKPKPEETALEAPLPDSGKADTVGESDEAFIKSYSAGKSDDHVRAKKILERMK